MTDTLIALISIFVGIIGANLVQFITKEYSFDMVGNSIAGVFGSIFLIKFFGRLGFNPTHIMASGKVNIFLFSINMFVSFLGGFVAVILIKKLAFKMNSLKKKEENPYT